MAITVTDFIEVANEGQQNNFAKQEEMARQKIEKTDLKQEELSR